MLWQAGDKLAAVGFDEHGNYLGVSRDFTSSLQGANCASSCQFSGTGIDGAVKYNVYFPSDIIVSSTGTVTFKSMVGQKQIIPNDTRHLKNYIVLEADNVIPSGNYLMKMKSSIMKFVCHSMPDDIGTLYSIILKADTNDGAKAQTLSFNAITLSGTSPSITAYMSFLPSEISGIKAGGKLKITLCGTKSYIYTLSSAGKEYEEGM